MQVCYLLEPHIDNSETYWEKNKRKEHEERETNGDKK